MRLSKLFDTHENTAKVFKAKLILLFWQIVYAENTIFFNIYFFLS